MIKLWIERFLVGVSFSTLSTENTQLTEELLSLRGKKKKKRRRINMDSAGDLADKQGTKHKQQTEHKQAAFFFLF